ncbi:MAG: zinc ribbon domain-containing protein [Phycisphaerae bacterium]|nr:zinc ribbon domain-containing protein [Phycisphaerae bacterium]
MPTYEYQCEECGSVFDVFQSIKASPLKKAECETCGKLRRVSRLIGTGAAVIFKGAGFYQTDYRSESYRKAAKSDSEAGSGQSAEKSGSDAKSTSESNSAGASSSGAKSAESKAPKPGGGKPGKQSKSSK